MIPISSVSIGTEEEELVLQVLRSGRLAQGPMVEQLEQEFRPWAGAEHVVAVSNGTVSLVAALEALQLPAGSEVITSPFTFVATLNAILEAGLVARFGDIDAADFALTAESVDAARTDRTAVRHARPPVRPAGRHGRPGPAGPAARAGARRGRGAGSRRALRRSSGRVVRGRVASPCTRPRT